MEQTILTPHQREVIAYMSQDESMRHFYLSGGTALAEYYLQHRLSDDLDFFTISTIDMNYLHSVSATLKNLVLSREVNYQRLYDRNIFVYQFDSAPELKVEWTHYPFTRLEPGIQRDGIEIDSLRDIAANKLMAFLDRFDPKDFVDLYFILQQFTLDQLRADAEVKFSVKVEPLFLGGQLARVGRISALPRMKKHVDIQDLKMFFTQLARPLSVRVIEE